MLLNASGIFLPTISILIIHAACCAAAHSPFWQQWMQIQLLILDGVVYLGAKLAAMGKEMFPIYAGFLQVISASDGVCILKFSLPPQYVPISFAQRVHWFLRAPKTGSADTWRCQSISTYTAQCLEPEWITHSLQYTWCSIINYWLLQY